MIIYYPTIPYWLLRRVMEACEKNESENPKDKRESN